MSDMINYSRAKSRTENPSIARDYLKTFPLLFRRNLFYNSRYVNSILGFQKTEHLFCNFAKNKNDEI